VKTAIVILLLPQLTERDQTMLVDPLPVKLANFGAASALTILSTPSFAITDVAPGRTTRVGDIAYSGINSKNAKITISHSVSKENGAIATDRTLVRLDLSDLRSASGVAGTGRAYAYFVAGVPRGMLDNQNVAFDALALVQMICGVIVVSPTAAASSLANLTRILAGEP